MTFTDIEQTIEIDGFKLAIAIERDDNSDAPWDNECGHGPVSEWTTRDKAPGELVLHTDRTSKRFYDYAEACRIALRDGWDSAPFNTGQETRRQQAAKAAMADFKRLRDWCNDEWFYCGVVVTASKNGTELGTASLWGIESDSDAYHLEVANELIAEALEQAKDTVAALTA